MFHEPHKNDYGLPEVPTPAEQGFAGFEDAAGIGLLAPASLNPATRISDAVMAALGEAEGRAQLEALAFRLTPAPYQALRGYGATGSVRWRDIVRRSGAVAN